MNRKDLADAMAKTLGEPTLIKREVESICSNLGVPYKNMDKKIPRVLAEEAGINPEIFHTYNDRGVYLAFSVWNYIKNMERHGKIKVLLEKRGIYSFNDILEFGYDRSPFSAPSGMTIGRRHGNGGRDDDFSFERAVKLYEK